MEVEQKYVKQIKQQNNTSVLRDNVYVPDKKDDKYEIANIVA